MISNHQALQLEPMLQKLDQMARHNFYPALSPEGEQLWVSKDGSPRVKKSDFLSSDIISLAPGFGPETPARPIRLKIEAMYRCGSNYKTSATWIFEGDADLSDLTIIYNAFCCEEGDMFVPHALGLPHLAVQEGWKITQENDHVYHTLQGLQVTLAADGSPDQEDVSVEPLAQLLERAIQIFRNGVDIERATMDLYAHIDQDEEDDEDPELSRDI